MQFNLNSDVSFILEQLNKNGNGFLVGGAVRDLIMRRDPGDYDFATDIEYSRLKKIFADYSPKEVGAHFGILLIKVNGKSYEIARFRKEKGVYNSRHPKEIKFIDNIDEDLARRDFTMNALAYSEKTGVIDLYGGKTDIKNGIIRFVGDPNLRIEEDALRIMRAFRFISKLGFILDKKTAEAIHKKRKFLNKISKERIFDELSKILLGSYAKKALCEMKKLGILGFIIPEFKQMKTFKFGSFKEKNNLFSHIVDTVSLCQRDLITRLAALFHDLGKINTRVIDAKGNFFYYGHEKESALIAEEKLRHFKASNDIVFSVRNLILNHMILEKDLSIKELKKLIMGLGEKNMARLFDLILANTNSKNDLDKEKGQILIDRLKNRIEEIEKMGKIPDIRDISISGVDLINLGFEAKEIGKIKNEIYDLILDEKLENEKEVIINYLSEKYNLGTFKREKSCGAVVYNPERQLFLIIKMLNGNWGFPKGHTENQETDIQTAIREVTEETGINIKILDGFKKSIKYIPFPEVLKKVIFFIGITEEEKVTIDKHEIEDYMWCSYEEALKMITYKPQRDIMESSLQFIKNYYGDDKNDIPG
jgi:polynucleotide adenylyltransferase/metal dependent phosphohydrolase